jgi:hypothetical protein
MTIYFLLTKISKLISLVSKRLFLKICFLSASSKILALQLRASWADFPKIETTTILESKYGLSSLRRKKVDIRMCGFPP